MLCCNIKLSPMELQSGRIQSSVKIFIQNCSSINTIDIQFSSSARVNEICISLCQTQGWRQTAWDHRCRPYDHRWNQSAILASLLISRNSELQPIVVHTSCEKTGEPFIHISYKNNKSHKMPAWAIHSFLIVRRNCSELMRIISSASTHKLEQFQGVNLVNYRPSKNCAKKRS